MMGVGAYLTEAAVFRYILILINTFVLSLILMACGPEIYRPKLVRVTEEDNEDTVSLNIGDKLEVLLEGNPTTGFQWETIGDFSPYLRQLGEPVYEPTGEGIGSGGKMIFAFEAVSAGQTWLELVYHQPFDEETPPSKTFGQTVVVKN
jgi:inhibitor of cysteine peptidase